MGYKKDATCARHATIHKKSSEIGTSHGWQYDEMIGCISLCNSEKNANVDISEKEHIVGGGVPWSNATECYTPIMSTRNHICLSTQ